MEKLAWIAVALSALAGCTLPKGSDAGVVMNGRCRCEDGATCVQQVDGRGATPVACVSSASASAGCERFGGESRRCWPSPTIAGLCMCSGAYAPGAVAGAPAAHGAPDAASLASSP